MIELTDIAKIYETAEGTRALAGIDLKFGRRGLVCVLGASGCGKTTLLNVIGGLDKPTSGRVTVDGRDLCSLGEKELNAYRNRRVGFVFQSGNLIPYLSVRENVGLSLSIAGANETECVAAASAALKRVGLEKEGDKMPSSLSGGQYQRAAIARAIVGQTDVILADEPTGSLDDGNGEAVMRLMKELSADRLVIVVTHNSALAEKYASRILRLSEGRVTCDTQPFSGEETADIKPRPASARLGALGAAALGVSRMKFGKARTIAVSVACSIGVIGICLVMAFMNGFHTFATGVEEDLLSAYAISVGDGDYDFSAFFADGGKLDIDKLDDEVYVKSKMTDAYFRIAEGEDINAEYLNYISGMDASLYDYIYRDYELDYDAHVFMQADLNGVAMNVSFDYIRGLATSQNEFAVTALGAVSYFTQLPDNRALVESGYELVYGKYPARAGDLVVVLDEDGCIDDYAMAFLGYYSMEDVVSYMNGNADGVKRLWSYEELAAKRFSFFNNDVVFTKGRNGFYTQNTAFSPSVRPLETADPNDGIGLGITGILKSKGSGFGGLASGVYYTSALDDYFLASSPGSAVVAETLATYEATGQTVNPLNGSLMIESMWKTQLRGLGGVDIPGGLAVYASSVENKREIISYLAAWNEAHPDHKITYVDNVSSIVAYVTDIAGSLSLGMLLLTLGAFAVAAVMLGVISFLSVAGRVKEIGILRCLGAGRGDILISVLTEPLLYGIFGGILGVALTYSTLAVCSAFLPFVSAGLLLWWQAIVAGIAGAAVSCAAGLAAAVKASSISPAVAAKEE